MMENDMESSNLFMNPKGGILGGKQNRGLYKGRKLHHGRNSF